MHHHDLAGSKQGTETEMVAFMITMGFDVVGDHKVRPNRDWLDKDFINTRRLGHPTSGS